MSVNVNLRSILESNELATPNFHNWLRNIKIVLCSKKILYILDKVPPKLPSSVAPIKSFEAYKWHKDVEDMAICLMLASMSPKL